MVLSLFGQATPTILVKGALLCHGEAQFCMSVCCIFTQPGLSRTHHDAFVPVVQGDIQLAFVLCLLASIHACSYIFHVSSACCMIFRPQQFPATQVFRVC